MSTSEGSGGNLEWTCALLTWTWHVKDLNASGPGKGQHLLRVRPRSLAKPFSDPLVSMDKRLNGVHANPSCHNFLLQGKHGPPNTSFSVCAWCVCVYVLVSSFPSCPSQVFRTKPNKMRHTPRPQQYPQRMKQTARCVLIVVPQDARHIFVHYKFSVIDTWLKM